MHSDWFNGIEILQGRWQRGEKVGYCYPSGLEKTICKWDMYVPLVTKGLEHKKKGRKERTQRHVRLYSLRSVTTSTTTIGRYAVSKHVARLRLLCFSGAAFGRICMGSFLLCKIHLASLILLPSC